MADPLGAPATDLAAAAAAFKTVGNGGFQPSRQGRGELTSGVEAAATQPRLGGRHRNDRPAQHVSRGQPLDPFRHQVGNREQAPELQRSNKVPGDSLVGGRRPRLIQSRRPIPQQRLSTSQPPPTSRADHRLRPTRAPARGANRRYQRHLNRPQDLHPPSLPGNNALMARTMEILRHDFETKSCR
jgi:hypothetical protein